MIRTARETLQGRPKAIKGGRSATMKYAYTYTLCRRAVVATFDLAARNLHLFKVDHWLSDPRNVIPAPLKESCLGNGPYCQQSAAEPQRADAFMVGRRDGSLLGGARSCRASRTGPNERREWRRFAPALARGPLQRGPPQSFCCAQSRCHQGCIFGVMSMCQAL